MKKLLFIVMVLLVAGLLGAVDVTIGEGTDTSRYPFNNYSLNSQSQCIYLESEIGSPGTIRKLKWYRDDSGSNTNAIGTTKIWLKTTANEVFTDAGWEDPGILVSQIINIDLSSNGGWYEIDINDFVYTGGNLIVSVHTQNSAKVFPYATWRYTETTNYMRCRTGSRNTAGSISLELSNKRPNFQIVLGVSEPTTIPNQAVLEAPLEGHWGLDGDLLKWKKSYGFPSTYDLYLDNVNPPQNRVSEGQTELFYTLENLAGGEKYYWQVVPRNQIGEAINCPVWTFNTPGENNLVESFEEDFPPPGWSNPGKWDQSSEMKHWGFFSAHRFVATNHTHILSTPKLRIKNDSILRFWGVRGITNEPLSIIYSADKENWSDLCTINYEEEDTWYQINTDLSSLAGNNYYLGFRVGPQGKNYYIDDVIGPEIFYDFPEGSTVDVQNDIGEDFSITMSGGSANQATETEIPSINSSSFTLSGSIVLDLIGTGPWTITIDTSAPWGAYYRDGNWHGVENNDGRIEFQLPALRTGLLLPIVLGNSDLSLSVELSSFSASLNARHQALLSWVSETETELLGYYLLRNSNNDLAIAEQISELIPATNTSLQQIYLYTDKELCSAGTYYYWLQACNMNGSVSFYGPIYLVYELPESGGVAVPLITGLQALYPNPFNPDLFINYSLAEAYEIELKIYNARGQLLRTLDKGSKNPGEYRLVWDGCDERGQSQSSGVYFIRLQTRKKLFIDKAVLLK